MPSTHGGQSVASLDGRVDDPSKEPNAPEAAELSVPLLDQEERTTVPARRRATKHSKVQVSGVRIAVNSTDDEN
jgi:hypothetical protein